jgi:hypothetical protein
MSPKTRTARKRRTTRRSVTRSRTAKRPRGASRGAAGYGPKLTRLLRARVLTRAGADRLGATAIDRIEDLGARQVQTLIDVANHVGRNPKCWLI